MSQKEARRPERGAGDRPPIGERPTRRDAGGRAAGSTPDAVGMGAEPEASGLTEYEVVIAETHYVPFRVRARSAEDAVRQVLDRGLGRELREYLEVGERRLESVERLAVRRAEGRSTPPPPTPGPGSSRQAKGVGGR